MKIAVINGSPKGEASITLQTICYLEKLYPGVDMDVLHVGQRIRSIENAPAEAMEKLKEARLWIFCYPVYTFLAPSQLHRFIELIKESGIDCSGKYATQLSTSKHFYDITAHRYIRENCEDLGLRYVDGLSADMEDLLHKKGQKEASAWFKHLLWSVRYGICKGGKPALNTVAASRTEASVPEKVREKKSGKRIVIVADLKEDNKALKSMIARFTAVCPYPCTMVNLQEFPFAGGCLGCFNCASSGKCIYRDGFDTFLREKIQTADATVYAFSIKDHSMGYRMKLYDDRQFCNGHRTVTMGKPVAYLVDGALSREENLRCLMEARAQVGGNRLAAVACNEEDTDRSIDMLAAELCYALKRNWEQSLNFYGVGGMKIFRDLIWQMQGLMREDHRFYKAHGFYDFPQKKRGTMAAMYLVGAMMRSEKLKKKIGANMTQGMLMPYRRIIENAGKK